MLRNPNLKDLYEANATAALRLPTLQFKHEQEMDALHSLLTEEDRALTRAEKALDIALGNAAPSAASGANRPEKTPDFSPSAKGGRNTASFGRS